MAQWLRVLAALPGVLSSILGSHTVTHYLLQYDLMPSSGVHEDRALVHKIRKQINLLKTKGGEEKKCIYMFYLLIPVLREL